MVDNESLVVAKRPNPRIPKQWPQANKKHTYMHMLSNGHHHMPNKSANQQKMSVTSFWRFLLNSETCHHAQNPLKLTSETLTNPVKNKSSHDWPILQSSSKCFPHLGHKSTSIMLQFFTSSLNQQNAISNNQELLWCCFISQIKGLLVNYDSPFDFYGHCVFHMIKRCPLVILVPFTLILQQFYWNWRVASWTESN